MSSELKIQSESISCCVPVNPDWLTHKGSVMFHDAFSFWLPVKAHKDKQRGRWTNGGRVAYVQS